VRLRSVSESVPMHERACVVHATRLTRIIYYVGKMTYHQKSCEIPKALPDNATTNFRWSVAAKLPCRIMGPYCHYAVCNPDQALCASSTGCPKRNYGAETCAGWYGRRKPVLQLPMRHSATSAHDDTDIRRRMASQSEGKEAAALGGTLETRLCATGNSGTLPV
jgi:hypothetical protein